MTRLLQWIAFVVSLIFSLSASAQEDKMPHSSSFTVPDGDVLKFILD
jgi:hypothetical protein